MTCCHLGKRYYMPVRNKDVTNTGTHGQNWCHKRGSRTIEEYVQCYPLLTNSACVPILPLLQSLLFRLITENGSFGSCRGNFASITAKLLHTSSNITVSQTRQIHSFIHLFILVEIQSFCKSKVGSVPRLLTEREQSWTYAAFLKCNLIELKSPQQVKSQLSSCWLIIFNPGAKHSNTLYNKQGQLPMPGRRDVFWGVGRQLSTIPSLQYYAWGGQICLL